MQIILVQKELEIAVQEYIRGQGLNMDEKTLSVDFAATRGSTGVTATIQVNSVAQHMSAPPAHVTEVIPLDTETPEAVSPFPEEDEDDEPADDTPVFG